MSKTRKTPKRKLEPKSNWRHICGYCDKKFPFPSNLDQHRRVHTGDRPFACNLCDYSASTKNDLTVHIRCHLGEKPFKCPESRSGCKFSSSQKGNVTQHHKVVHLREKIFGCPNTVCGYKTGKKSHLTRHMTTHEKNPDRPFKCELCPYRAKTKGDLKGHMINIHSEERSFKCGQEVCGYTAKTTSDLKRHLATHGERKLNCSHPKCEYKTNNKACLNQHMQIHSSASDSEKRYKCRICDYSSHQSGNLTVHMRIHTKETPYKCKIQGCLFKAKESSSLKRHARAVHEKR